jgi:hypothetical protein
VIKQRQFKRSERAASVLRDDVLRVTRGQTMRWVAVHDLAHRLGFEDDVMEAAVRSAIERGWFVGDGDPPHSVRLSTGLIQALDHLQDLS